MTAKILRLPVAGNRFWRTQRAHATCERHLPRPSRIALYQYPDLVELPHLEHDLTWMPTHESLCDTCWFDQHRQIHG
jgi:hypothetical protein